MSVTAIPPIPRQHARLAVGYHGEGWPLLWLMLRGLALTALTLGVYRFWLKARLRRHYWSSIRVGGQPLEFTGTGVEMLLGFLIAVVFLAIYLGLINLFLAFIGLAVFQNQAALNLSILAVVPLVYYAAYRARRYLLSRTRWRGIRFGMEQGAIGYMVRALGYVVLAVVSLGLLVPLMDYRLRKYAVDRSWWGDMRFRQEGSWTGFLKPWLWVYASLGLVAGGLAATALLGVPAMGGLVVIGVICGVIAVVHYSIATMRYAIGHTRLGDGVRFASGMRTGRVIGIYVVGSILISIIMSLVFAILSAIALGMASSLGLLENIGDVFDYRPGGLMGDGDAMLAVGATVVLYLLGLLLVSALSEVLIAQPLLQHYAETMALSGTGELDAAAQRPHDQMTEAEGFADALDVGAAF
jgi:uncharacterized membrane protein YjgN (DUF898 family)